MEAIFACTHNGGIGLNGKLPWRIKEDMKLFKTITTNIESSDKETGQQKQNAVIMGRNTWESIPKKFRPLPNRINIILSTTMDKKEVETGSVYIANTLEELDTLIEQLKKEAKLATPFIIGGATLYNKMFELDKISKVHLSLLNKEREYECDTFLDMKYIDDKKFEMIEMKPFEKFTYIRYHNTNQIMSGFLIE
jgi:dihydrofolate reductase